MFQIREKEKEKSKVQRMKTCISLLNCNQEVNKGKGAKSKNDCVLGIYEGNHLK